MDPITIAMLVAAGVKGVTGLVKGITGASQMSKANKVLNSDMPKYSRPEEYNKLLSIYQKQANMGQLPGQDRYEAKISESTSRGVRAAAKYADSPVAAVSAASQLYGQQQSAIRDLGLQFAAYQQQAQQNLAGAYQKGADYSDREWYYNEMYPDQVKRNIAANRWSAGQQNLWGGIDMLGSAAIQGFGAGLGAQNNGSMSGGGINAENMAGMQNIANSAQGSAMNIYSPGTYQQYFPSSQPAPYVRSSKPWE